MIWALMTMLAVDKYLEEEQEDLVIEVILEDDNELQAN